MAVPAAWDDKFTARVSCLSDSFLCDAKNSIISMTRGEDPETWGDLVS